MSSAVLSVPSATQGGSLLWLFRALGVVVLIYLAFMGVLFTCLLCWASHKRSRSSIDMEKLKEKHAKAAEEFDKALATLALINQSTQLRRQQAAEMNQHFEDVDARIKTITQEDLTREAWRKNVAQRSLAKA